MTHVTCRLAAKYWDQLRNPMLGNRVWATFLGSGRYGGRCTGGKCLTSSWPDDHVSTSLTNDWRCSAVPTATFTDSEASISEFWLSIRYRYFKNARKQWPVQSTQIIMIYCTTWQHKLKTHTVRSKLISCRTTCYFTSPSVGVARQLRSACQSAYLSVCEHISKLCSL